MIPAPKQRWSHTFPDKSIFIVEVLSVSCTEVKCLVVQTIGYGGGWKVGSTLSSPGLREIHNGIMNDTNINWSYLVGQDAP